LNRPKIQNMRNYLQKILVDSKTDKNVKSWLLKVNFKPLLLIILIASTNSVFAGTITTSGSGDWSSTTPNAPWPNGVIPVSTDDVIIGNGFTLTVDVNKTCNAISFTAPSSGTGTGTLTVNSGVVLTVISAVSATAPTVSVKISGTYNISGNGQVSCAALNVNNALSPGGSSTTSIALISTINTLSISGNINIYATYANSGSKSNNGKLNIQTGRVIVNGSINTVSSNAVNSPGIDLVSSANNPSLILSGVTPFNLSAVGTNNISLNGSGATVTYNYAGPQTVYNTSYTNLTLSGSGAKTMPAASMAVTGNLSVAGTASANAGGALTVGGNVSIGSGSTFAGGSFSHNLAGNWSNNGTFSSATSTISLNGVAAQTISGTSPTVFNNLNLNNTTGAVISTSPVINGTLTFTNGKITTGANKVTLGSAATTTGAGAGKYIYGNEEILIPNANAPARTFDIGDFSNYTPVNIAFNGVTSGSGSLTASTRSGDHADIVNSGINPSLSVNRTWTLSNTGVAGFTSYAATLNYLTTDNDPSTVPSNFVVRLSNGSNWNTTNLVSASTLSAQANGITTFGTFQVGTPATAPAITTNPVAVAACSTNGTSFTATASSSPAANIKWQCDPNTGTFADITSTTDGGVYANYTSATMNITKTTGLTNFKYRAVFTNINGSTTSASATLSVTSAPSATFSYGATAFCNTGSAPVNLTGGTTGGSFSSTTGLNISSTTGLIDLANSTAGNYAVTYSFPAAGACPIVQNNLNLTINPIGTWTGAFNTSWNVAGNWQCNVIPTSTTNVTIPSVLSNNYPIISIGIVGAANNLTVETDATITISGGTLQIAGIAATTGGKITAASGKVEFNGSAAQVIPANLFTTNTIKDLVVTNLVGVTLNAAVRVTNTVGFGNVNYSVLNSNGFLTLVSTVSNTANVTDITNKGLNRGNKINGNVIIERYMLSKRAFRFYTAPVNSTTSLRTNWMENTNNPSTSVNNNPAPGYGTHITAAGGNSNAFDQTNTNNPSLYTYDNPTHTWIAAANTSGLFTAGNGFRLLVRGSRSVDLNNNAATPSTTTLRATGTLVTGPVVFAATGGTTGVPVLSNVIGGYNFIANPYASSVDWASVLSTATDISETMYIFDPTITGSNGRGGYAYYNSILKAKMPLTSLVTKDIQSGQAFFVQTTGANPSLTFNETSKSTGFLPVFRTANDVPHLTVDLLLPEQVGTASAADGTGVYFSDDYSSKICNDDSYKFTNQDENIAILRDGMTLSIEGRKSVAGTDSVPLKIWQLTKKSYALKIAIENFSSSIQGYLEDKFFNVSTPLVAGENIIQFSITSDAASSASDRFKVVLRTLAALPVKVTGIKAYAKNKGVQVEWVAESESNINIYEVERSPDAQLFATIGSVTAKNNPGIATTYNFFDINPNTGDNYYRIKSVEKSGDVKLSEVVRVQLAEAKNSISVTDNPVIGGCIKLLFDNVTRGAYVANLISASGEKIYTGKISYDGGKSYEQLALKNGLSAGIYQLQLSNGTFNKTIALLIR
jgi:hypothetical protein